MKSNKEIRKEADFLYSKSSHYIGGLFMLVGAITAAITGIITVIAEYLNMPLLILLSVLIAPLEYGLIKATLLSYDRKAREVSRNNFAFLGIKKLNKSLVPFVGKSIVISIIQFIVLQIFLFIGKAPTNDFIRGVIGLFSKQLDYIYSNNQFLVLGTTAIGFIIALVVGVLLECAFALSYYFVVDKEEGLIASLKESLKYMKGNLWRFIKLRLSFLPYIFLCAVISGVINYLINDTIYGWFQLTNASTFILDIFVSVAYGVISSIITVMIYSVKESLAFVVFYKEITKD